MGIKLPQRLVPGPNRRRNTAAGALVGITTIFVLLVSACTGAGSGISGTISVDGSSTVFPIAEAVAEEFRFVAPRVRTQVGVSGTGGGFKRFCAGETDISNASRPIKPIEQEACEKKGIEYLVLTVALDGVSVVVSRDNDFVDSLTTDELKRLWEPGSKITRWNQIRPEWPDRKIELFGPDTDSGTFDYFTEVIVGEEDASRADYTASSDDNVLVKGISGERWSLGYFGYAYFEENQNLLRVVPIDPGDGNPISPTRETINDGSYQPLSRPLFIYVNVASLRESEAVREFVGFFLTEGPTFIPEVGYVPLPEEGYLEALATVAEALE